MRFTRSVVALAGAALLTTAAGVTATAEVGAGWQTGAQPGDSQRVLTLLTGDRVAVTVRPGMPEQVRFLPTAGSGSAGATVSRANGHTFVVPFAARTPIASGRVDRQLFDITTLLAQLGDDQASDRIPVIVEYDGPPREAAAKAQRALPGTADGTALTSIGARAESVRRTTAKDFWQSLAGSGLQKRSAQAVRKVSLDRKVAPALDWSVPQIGAPTAWKRGLTGKGIKVAVLDTGIDATHPDLKGKVQAAKDFSGSGNIVDHHGHGTHVAGTIGGTGAASKGKYRGVAPDVTLLNGKVIGDDGMSSESKVIAGMEWAVAQGAKVVNLSLHADGTDGTSALARSLDALSKKSGTLFVAAAGNGCGRRGLIQAPGAAEQALTVANLERDGSLNESSCLGPNPDHTGKPDIAAPGTDIVAALAAGSEGEPVDKYYTPMTGTSMATPHVVGTAALLAQQHGDWKGDRIKARLISTADPLLKQPLDDSGTGRVDADQATDNGVTVDTAELEMGTYLWPHRAPKPFSQVLTYQNNGTTAVTLNLTAPLDAGDNGAAAKLSTTKLVVPAKGKASVTVSADPGLGKVGRHTGRVVATPTQGDPLYTSYGWFLEPEMYDVTVKGVLGDGTPADSLLFVTRPDGGPVETWDGNGGPDMINGVAKMRIEPGVYSIVGTFLQPATAKTADKLVIAAQPEVRIRKATTITLDARKAVPVGVSLAGKHQLAPAASSMAYYRLNRFGKLSGFEEVEVDDTPIELRAVPTSGVTVGKMEFSAATRLETPPYRMKLGTQELRVAELTDGPRIAGTKQLTAVDAGTGTAADLKRAVGKLAVVALDGLQGQVDVARAAQQAKVAGVLFYDPNVAGFGVDELFLGDRTLRIPVLQTSREVAKTLTGKVVRIDGTNGSPEVFDLLKAWPGRVPLRPVHQYRKAQLARIAESYAAHSKVTQLWESKVGYTPLGEAHGLRPLPLAIGPFQRTAYVTPGAWEQRVDIGSADSGSRGRAAAYRYRTGERRTVAWGGPVATSGLPSATTTWPSDIGVQRTGKNLVIGLAPFVAGGAQYEEPDGLSTGTYALSLKRDGKVLVEAEELLINGPVPDAPGNYQLALDVQRSEPWWKYSTQIRSTWDFRSRAGAAETMLLILADLGLPQATNLNQVRVGTATPLTVSLRHQTGAPTASFKSVKLLMSYDGRSWTPVPLAKKSDTLYTASVNHPAARAGGTVDLKLDVTDAAGGRLQQQVTKAYGLTK
ncbi:S8 family serine peptidase [Kribbella sp. NPDC056951]|uniref:S8 family peptidase n=1 Tax=Kribbella sp. NPDC056951 TaxID=3345978 RepID=UPI00363F584A